MLKRVVMLALLMVVLWCPEGQAESYPGVDSIRWEKMSESRCFTTYYDKLEIHRTPDETFTQVLIIYEIQRGYDSAYILHCRVKGNQYEYRVSDVHYLTVAPMRMPDMWQTVENTSTMGKICTAIMQADVNITKL